jgi:hypothetical protein
VKIPITLDKMKCRILKPIEEFYSNKIKIHIIILPVVLHGYETWSLTLREEHRLKGV